MVMAADRGAPQVRDVPPLASLTRRAPRPAWSQALWVALVLAGAATAAGCDADTTRPQHLPPPSQPAPAALDPGIEYRDGDAVCDAFVRSIMTRDAQADGSPAAAFRRAAPYMTTSLSGAAAGSRADASWQHLVDHEAHTQVVTSHYAGDAAPESAQPTRSRLAIVTAVGRDGWQGPPARFAVHCVLEVLDQGRLLVSAYEIEPLGP